MSRQTIGENPLDAFVTTSEDIEEKPKDKKSTINKKRLTVQIRSSVIERAKNAVYWTRGLTLARLTEDALEKSISDLEESRTIYDDTGNLLKKKGDLFPKRREELKSGRPVD